MKHSKFFAAITAAAVAISMCGCMDNGKIMTVDGMEINNGVYLYYQQSAYSAAQSKINSERENELNDIADDITGDTSSDESSSSSSSSSSTVKYFSTSIDGKSTSQWVKDETLRLVKQYVAVQRLCEQKGISLDRVENDDVSKKVASVWDDTNYYIQYFYGFDTAGKYYESNGIGRESYTLINTVSALKDKLFTRLYDKDGETPVSEEEFLAYVKENYAAVELLKLDYKDADGNALTSDSDKKAVDEQAQKYADRLSGGESFVDVKYDFDLKAEQDKSREQIEDYYDKNPVKGKTKEEYVAEEIAKLTVDKAESEDEIISYYNKNSNSLDEAVSEFVFSAKDDGKAALLKTDDCVYVIARVDITAREKWLESSRNSILINIKGTDYESFLDEFASNLTVEANSYLVDSKYKPEKLENVSPAL